MIFADDHVIMVWDFLMVEHIFLSPQVKRSLIISNKHGIYELLITYSPSKLGSI